MFSVNVNIVLTVVCVAPPANKMSNHIISVHCVPPYLALVCSAMLTSLSLSMGPEM